MNTAISIPEIPKPPFRHYFRCRRGPLSWNQRLTGATTPFSAAFKSATEEVGLARRRGGLEPVALELGADLVARGGVLAAGEERAPADAPGEVAAGGA